MKLTGPRSSLVKLAFACLASIPVSLTAVHFNALGVKDLFLLTLVPLGAVLVLTASWDNLTKQMTASARILKKSTKKISDDKPSYEIPVRSASITIVVFGLVALFSHAIMMSQVLKLGYESDVVYNFVLFENIASILTALIVLNWNRVARLLKR